MKSKQIIHLYPVWFLIFLASDRSLPIKNNSCGIFYNFHTYKKKKLIANILYDFVCFYYYFFSIWQREKKKKQRPYASLTHTHAHMLQSHNKDVIVIPLLSPSLSLTCTGSTRSLSAARTLTHFKRSCNMSFSSSPWPVRPTGNFWNMVGREEEQGRAKWGGGEGGAGGGEGGEVVVVGGRHRASANSCKLTLALATGGRRERAPQLAHARSKSPRRRSLVVRQKLESEN